jgi:citrate lyase subunit gamma (acyl carrier protein)
MALLQKPAQAGTVESGDIVVILAPAEPGAGIRIELESIVKLQYGAAIRKTVTAILQASGIRDANVHLNDRGALDCTIQARTKTALNRAGVVVNGGDSNA